MPQLPCKMSALLLMSLVPFAAGLDAEGIRADADELAERHQECSPQIVAAGLTCEGSPDLLDGSDDALSLLQHGASVAGSASKSASRSSFENLVQSAISMYEENGGKVTPAVQKFLTAVLKEIEGLYPSIKEEHSTSVKDLGKAYAAVEAVVAGLGKSKKTAAEMGAVAATSRKELSTCRAAESGIWSRHQKCLGEKKDLTAIKDGKSKVLADTATILKGMFPPKISLEDVLKPGFRSKLDGLVEQLDSQNTELNTAIANLDKKTKECAGIAKDLSSKKADCDEAQSKFEAASCTHATFIAKMCKDFAKDFAAAVKTYEEEIKTSEALEADRKVEWTGLKHAQCILKAISGENLSAGKIESCKSETVATGHLDINPKATPGKPSCPSVPPYPCTATFLDNEYSKMPKGTKAAKCEACGYFIKVR